MKLILKKNIFIFLLFTLLAVCLNSSIEFENFELEETDRQDKEVILTTNITKGLPNVKPEEVNLPADYGSLLQGYTFIFGVDDPNKDYKVLDQFDSYEVALLVYKNITKSDKVGRLALDMREFAWKCGPKKSCPVENLYTNITEKEIDVNGLKSQINTFFSKINSISKVCIGDIYVDADDKKKAIVFCFNSQNDLEKFEKLFDYVNEKDLNNGTTSFDPETDQTFDLEFSDGHDTLVKKKINFKVDGMYENNKLLLKYDVLETFDGKKCNIAQDLPIVPIKFLESKIFSPKCVAKFKFNKIDTYVGTGNQKCADIMSYVIIKMKSSCNKVKNGPLNKFSNELVSRPNEGKWTGWIRYHKIMDNGGTIDPHPYKININHDLIQIYDEQAVLKQKIDHKNITWSCNNDGDCDIREFILYLNHSGQKTKLADFEKVAKQLVGKWALQDYNHCFIIEENDIHIICPLDYSEEYSARLALAVAIDKMLVDATAETFVPYKNGTMYDIIHSTDTEIFFKDHSITVLPQGVKNQNGTMVIEYGNIKPLKNIQCGFEFRLLSLPNPYHEINPYCCARFFTDENNYVCMQQQSKCYIPLRHMIQLMRTNCLFAQGSSTNNTNPTDKSPLKPDLNTNITKTDFGSEIVFYEIDNYKDKGEMESLSGYLNLNPNNITYLVNNEKFISLSLVTVNLLCDSPYPCLPSEYVRHQEPFLEKDYDRDWQESSLSKFWKVNTNINQDDCMVLTSEDNFYETSRMILTCTKTKGLGKNMRQSITDAYNNKISKLEGKEKEFKEIPPANDNREFDILLVATLNTTNPHSVQAATTKIKVALDGIMYKASGEYLFKYVNILDSCEKGVHLKFKLNEKTEIPRDMIKRKATPSCCFKSWSDSGSVFYICTMSGPRCHNDKATLYRAIEIRSKKNLSLMKTLYKRQKIAKASPSDPFDYGLTPELKEFSAQFNLDNLNDDIFDNSKNGIYEGWVYESSLTERNYNRHVSPVWMQIGNSKISFKTDDDSPAAYKVMNLNQYNQICPNHCLPNEYIEKKILSSQFDDIMYLKKSVYNILGQIKNSFVDEGCVILDFVSPIYNIGRSNMICGVDKMQGDKIRQAIDNSYYQSLLDLNIENDVRKPSLESDIYFAKLIINNKIIQNFNNFFIDLNGLVGRKMPLDPKASLPIGKERFNLTYSLIADDNFGGNCGFWYKNLKIKQSSEETKKEISDDNCCFRFFTKPDKKKIEICTFNIDGSICIKQARELMKGMKDQCLKAMKYSTENRFKNDDQKETKVDVYHEKTIDDNENGVFEGFIYFGNALSSSQTLKSNPYYIKIQKLSIEIYVDHTQTTNSTYSINTENLQFNCEGKSPCSPDDFLVYAQTIPKYMTVVSQIKTVYKLFKETYSISENFQSSCFVLETNLVPYLICPYISQNSNSMKKALTQAYILNLSCRRLSSVPDSDPSEKYKIIRSISGSQSNDEVVVNIRGVVSTKSNSVVIDYTKIDSDPITKKRCAFWYKELPVKFKLENPECCFAASVSGQLNTICVQSIQLCVSKAFKLMKSMWNGCMYSTPSQNIMKPSPDSEILGEPHWKPKIKFDTEKNKYDVCPNKRNTSIFEMDKLKNDYMVDIYNDIAYSLAKTLYKGWFNVYPVEISEESTWSLLKYYGELTPEAFKFYKNEKDKSNPKLVVRPDMLAMSCGKENACKPMMFFDFLIKHNTTLDYLRTNTKSKLDLYELQKEEGCAVLENIVANIPNYFIICPHIKKTRTTVPKLQEIIDKPTSYSLSRNLLSAHYGTVIRKIVYDSYLISRKYVAEKSLPEGEEPLKTVRISFLMSKNEHTKVTVSNLGVVSNSALVVKFDDLPICKVRYNLIYVPEDMVYDKKQVCCMRFRGPTSYEYACIKELNCEYSTYKFAKRFNELCVKRKSRKKDDAYNELSTGNNVNAMSAIKNVFKAEIKYTDIKKLNPTNKISTEEFKTKHKTLAISFLFKIKDLMHAVNTVEITSSKKLVTTHEDTTAIDTSSEVVSTPKPRYIGQSNDFTITSAENKVIIFKENKSNDQVTVIRNIQLIKTKEFSAIIGDKSEYIVLIYTDDGNKILEIQKGGVLLTNTAANLNSSFKSVEDYAKAAGITVPQE